MCINNVLVDSAILKLLIPSTDEKKKKKKKKKKKGLEMPIFMAEPMRASNSFVGTEEYIAPVSFFFSCYYLKSKCLQIECTSLLVLLF